MASARSGGLAISYAKINYTLSAGSLASPSPSSTASPSSPLSPDSPPHPSKSLALPAKLPAKVDKKDLQPNGKLLSDEIIDTINAMIENGKMKRGKYYRKSRSPLKEIYAEHSIKGYSIAVNDDGEFTIIYKGRKHKRHLGRGGFSKIKLAMEGKTAIWLACKNTRINDGLSSEEKKAREERLKREAAILNTLADEKSFSYRIYQKPSQSGRDYTTFSMMMPFIEGKDLYTFCSKRQLTHEQIILIMQNVHAAMQKYLAKGILHRDLKLENIMINPETLEVFIIDFNLGDIVSEAKVGSVWVGTANATAPEIFPPLVEAEAYANNKDPEYHYSTTTEIYALGVLFLDLLYYQWEVRNTHERVDFLSFCQENFGVRDPWEVVNEENDAYLDDIEKHRKNIFLQKTSSEKGTLNTKAVNEFKKKNNKIMFNMLDGSPKKRPGMEKIGRELETVHEHLSASSSSKNKGWIFAEESDDDSEESKHRPESVDDSKLDMRALEKLIFDEINQLVKEDSLSGKFIYDENTEQRVGRMKKLRRFYLGVTNKKISSDKIPTEFAKLIPRNVSVASVFFGLFRTDPLAASDERLKSMAPKIAALRLGLSSSK